MSSMKTYKKFTYHNRLWVAEANLNPKKTKWLVNLSLYHPRYGLLFGQIVFSNIPKITKNFREHIKEAITCHLKKLDTNESPYV